MSWGCLIAEFQLPAKGTGHLSNFINSFSTRQSSTQLPSSVIEPRPEKRIHKSVFIFAFK